MGDNIEEVKNLETDLKNSSISRNEHVCEQTRARITTSESSKGHGKLENVENEMVPVYTANTFFESFNYVIRAMFSPHDEEIKKRWFKNNSESVIGLVGFYFYRSILTVFYLIYSIYALYEYLINKSKIKFLSMAYRPNDDPSVINADVNKLAKIPQKLATVLNYKSEQEEGGGIEGLCNDGASISAWCLSSGISNLTIYEVSGVLKQSIPELSKAIFEKFESYFGTENVPNFLIKVPHLNLSYSGIDGNLIDNNLNKVESEDYQITISLLSKVDGRSTIVELTKVMAQLSKSGELKKSDITLKFLDHELKQLIGDEPDLIILFQPYLDLQGYPPWHIRLSEMYWEPDNETVSYIVFLRALQKYSTCKVNVGR